jgi:MFS superfamily sulfate permease-like transporter
MASTVALMVGVIMVALAPVLGWFMNFVPSPVIMGFTTGGGLIIALGQLKDIMGYTIRKDRLHEGIHDFFADLKQTHSITCAMGVSAAAFLFILRKLGQGRILWWKVKMPKWVKQVTMLPWAFGLVVMYTGISSSLDLKAKGVDIVGYVPPGLPPLKLPTNIIDKVPKLISVTITIVLIGYLESIAVETKFAHMFKYQINPTQESLAQGMANIFAGLTSAYPAVGSFSRSATNAAYGAKTPMCNFIAAMVVMICLLVLTPYLYYMPKVILASIVVVAALSLVEWPEFVYLFRTNKFEFLIIVLTFLLTAFVSLEVGIYASVGVCGFVVLFQATQPKVTMLGESRMFIYLPGSTSLMQGETDAKAVMEQLDAGPTDDGVLFCHVEGGLIYAAAGQVKRLLTHRLNILSKTRRISRFIFDLSAMSFSDSTALKALIAILEDLESRSIAACIVGPPKGLLMLMPHARVHKKMRGVSLFRDMLELRESGWLTPGVAEASIVIEGADPATSHIFSDLFCFVPLRSQAFVVRPRDDGCADQLPVFRCLDPVHFWRPPHPTPFCAAWN